ncbi:hypothetical protein NDU88_003629 [Pleurodeles waltl]|uniref:Uncharacterized protein n=1 Tax=Pleurodeles waltl TaxID=8319 RepID=A0AAV7WU58_PLEWA|nr:hypothetical protein NDU88_003629 [Pleurodeles waltl]
MLTKVKYQDNHHSPQNPWCTFRYGGGPLVVAGCGVSLTWEGWAWPRGAAFCGAHTSSSWDAYCCRLREQERSQGRLNHRCWAPAVRPQLGGASCCGRARHPRSRPVCLSGADSLREPGPPVDVPGSSARLLDRQFSSPRRWGRSGDSDLRYLSGAEGRGPA